MSIRRAISTVAGMLLITASLAMAAASLAHRFALKDPTPEMIAYLSVGGTLDALCGEAGQDSAGTRCAACLLGAAAPGPAPHDSAAAPLDTQTMVFAPPRTRTIVPVKAGQAPPVRAPPRV
ncbi:hypothetical protein [uncultured Roseobacter sp.]|uniref:hypothetical protein n=1 Tax=uncultured Roseobacter sp. TaxID=114847 RepID=UPI00260551DA|nr:hypothetical protein [uncultured Roseobacter sp.]